MMTEKNADLNCRVHDSRHKAILCFGSNTEGAGQKISEALVLIEQRGRIVCKSHGYRQPSHNGIGKPYLNVVCAVDWNSDLESLVDFTKRIEADLGRLATHTEVMPIDIDVVVFDNVVVKAEDFESPHFLEGYASLKIFDFYEPA